MATRNCNQCGTEYDGRNGVGGSCARENDAELFPYNGETGVSNESPHWMHGAFCSDACYSYAYDEPPLPKYNW